MREFVIEHRFYFSMGMGVLMIALSIAGVFVLTKALRTGSILNPMIRGPHGAVTVTRWENPIGFWFLFLVSTAGVLFCICAVYVLFRYPEGAHNQLSLFGMRIKW
jgi:hypothetical protein